MVYPKTKKGGYPDRAKPSLSVDEIEKTVRAVLEATLPLSEGQKCILEQAEVALETKAGFKRAKTVKDGFKILQKGLDKAKRQGEEGRVVPMFNWASVQIERGKLYYWQKLIAEKKEAESTR